MFPNRLWVRQEKTNGLHLPLSVLVIFETSQAVPRKNVHLSGIRPAGDNSSPRKQPTFGEATTSFPAKWRLRNEHRNSILMTCHYQDLGSTSDCFWLDEANFQPIRSTQDPDLGSDTTSDVIFAGKLVLRLLIYSLTLLHRKEIKKLVEAWRNVGCFLRLGIVDDAGIPKSEWSNTFVKVGTKDILIRPADHSLLMLCD